MYVAGILAMFALWWVVSIVALAPERLRWWQRLLIWTSAQSLAYPTNLVCEAANDTYVQNPIYSVTPFTILSSLLFILTVPIAVATLVGIVVRIANDVWLAHRHRSRIKNQL